MTVAELHLTEEGFAEVGGLVEGRKGLLVFVLEDWVLGQDCGGRQGKLGEVVAVHRLVVVFY